MDAPCAHVLEAQLGLDEGLDPGAVGAAVTVELCGHWEHVGPCRWPHNSEIDAEREPALFRTLFVCDEGELADVSERVVRALRGAEAWRVVALAERPVAASERALAERLRSGPRAPA
jgi:hypothetical protein